MTDDVALPAAFATMPPGLEVMVYSVIEAPPSDGAPQVTVAPFATFAAASAFMGASGAVGSDVPLELLASPPWPPPPVPKSRSSGSHPATIMAVTTNHALR